MAKKKASFTISEAAKYLGVTRAAVHLAIQRKKLHAKWGTVKQKALLINFGGSRGLEAYKVNLTRQQAGKKIDLA